MADAKKQSRRPEDTDFQQQRLKAWQPLLTPNWVIATFTVVGLLFIPIGIIIYVASGQVVELTVRYDNLPECQQGFYDTPANTSCVLEFNIEETMKNPYFYFELRNFYQNHRRYVKSRADDQLRGKNVLSGLSSCDPLETWSDSAGSYELYPCGLIANSYFNDTFLGTLCPENGTCSDLTTGSDCQWCENGIAWPSDLKEKFKEPSTPVDERNRYGPGGFLLPDVKNEHFVVWMRTAGLPQFKKLYARLPSTELKKGDVLRINVTSVFPVSAFDGEKYVVLSTTTWLGGKNLFLGLAYIIVGCICLLLAALFGIKTLTRPRHLGDMKYFNWPGQRRPQGA